MTEIRKKSFIDRFRGFSSDETAYVREQELVSGNRYPQPEPAPAQPQSLIGNTAAALHNALTGFRNQEAIYRAEVTAKTEALRQVHASIAAVEAALGMIDDDPALTEEERRAMGMIDENALDEAIQLNLAQALEAAEASGNGG